MNTVTLSSVQLVEPEPALSTNIPPDLFVPSGSSPPWASRQAPDEILLVGCDLDAGRTRGGRNARGTCSHKCRENGEASQGA